MPIAPLDPALVAEAAAAVEEHGTKAAAARALGISRETLRDRVLRETRRAAMRGEVSNPPLPAAAVPPPGFVLARAGATFGPDGTLRSQSVQTRPDSPEYVAPEGFELCKESVQLSGDGRVLSRWVQMAPGATASLADALAERFAAYEGMAPLIPAPEQSEDDTLTLYPVVDLHFGLYSWKPETGADYDTEIAGRIARQTIGTLVSRSSPSKRAVVLVLGDYFHQDDQKNATPSSGHRLDVDGRWGRVFAGGAKLMTDIVDLVAQRHMSVDVVVIPGNHDENAAICLRVALSLFYSNNPRISVYNEPGLHWYSRHGAVLLGASHGHTMKPSQMAMMLACDRPKDWGETEHRHFFFGHLHSESAKEVGAVRVEGFNTLAARDAYAQGGGWRSARSMSAITFHSAFGEVSRQKVVLIPEMFSA